MDEKNQAEVRGYNDSELQDIMSEIENLEKEFIDEPSSVAEVVSDAELLKFDSNQVKKTSLQEEIDREIANVVKGDEEVELSQKEVTDSQEHVFEEKKEEVEEVPPPNVISMTPATEAVPSMPSMEMNFHITGRMDLKYHVTMKDEVIHLTINSEGLCVELDNGAKFSMPLWQQGMKKKSA